MEKSQDDQETLGQVLPEEGYYGSQLIRTPKRIPHPAGPVNTTLLPNKLASSSSTRQ